jgi:hypothetical protein
VEARSSRSIWPRCGACGALWTVYKGINVGDLVLCPDGAGSYLRHYPIERPVPNALRRDVEADQDRAFAASAIFPLCAPGDDERATAYGFIERGRLQLSAVKGSELPKCAYSRCPQPVDLECYPCDASSTLPLWRLRRRSCRTDRNSRLLKVSRVLEFAHVRRRSSGICRARNRSCHANTQICKYPLTS